MNDYSEAKGLWEKFKEDIKHRNRYFSGAEIIEILNTVKFVGDIPSGYKYDYMYRARVGDYLEEEDNKVLAPPKEIAKEGRCNPDGISYLYLADNEKTAISEVKANIGEVVTITKLEVDGLAKFSFDLYCKNPKLMEKYSENRVTEELIKIINEDLSRVITNQEAIDYVPLQFLSEFIKIKTDYEALSYSSSISEGTNYVIFEPNKLNIRIVEKYLVKIQEIKYEYKRL